MTQQKKYFFPTNTSTTNRSNLPIYMVAEMPFYALMPQFLYIPLENITLT